MSQPVSDTKRSDNAARRMARLAAVQGLYQMALTQCPAEDILRNFRDRPEALLQEPDEGDAPPPADRDLFGNIVSGVAEHMATLDEMIAGALDPKVSADRIEILLRAILRAGVFELYRHGDTSSGVIINDYVDVAHAFFGAKEPGLVNAVLDKLAKNLRPN